MAIAIEQARELPIIEIEPLIIESQNEGTLLVRRLVNDWTFGTNRFDKEGEVLLLAKDKNVIVGLCGLNIDPYYPLPSLGRVRHLYVLSSQRRLGIGSQLIKQIIERARQHFKVLNLRTNSAEANKFYLAQGFQRSYERPECTHILYLK